MANVTRMPVDFVLENDSFDYKDYEYIEENCLDSSHFKAVFIPVLYSLVLVLGLLGNGLVLAVLWQKRRSWIVMDTFILHLGVADTLLLLTLPFWAGEAAQRWSFGTPLCKLTGALFKINFYCGIFLLACISLDRYLSIIHNVQMYSRKKVVQASCLFVWLFCLLLSIPDWVFLAAGKNVDRGGKVECTHHYPAGAPEWRLASRLLYHIVGFLLPAAVMVFCYSCILLRLHRGSQGLRVILALVVAFFISWTPYNITLLVDTFHPSSGSDSDSGSCSSHGKTALEASRMVTAALGCLHSCLNPLIYVIFCRKFRHHLLDMVMCHSNMPAESLWDSSGAKAPPHLKMKIVCQSED